ncbi:MAG TPA: methyltransferase domain-containing protein [Longimicrobium sp.]|nr:methyltransferase domain-containing protein [Longimicrobium sp.]
MADWYTGWVGAGGSDHHRNLAIPALLDLLHPAAGEHVLDIGCGPGVLAPHLARAGARCTGVDASRRLVRFARQHHGASGRFVVGDATRLAASTELQAGGFDAAVFLLSIQDIDPLEDALASAAWALRDGGRIVLLMTHPCFRIPRQSGWGWDEGRQLRFRRVDSYLNRLAVPMKAHAGGGATRSYHRPLAAYVNGLAECGLYVDHVREIPRPSESPGPHARAERRASEEIPLFLGLRAVKP